MPAMAEFIVNPRRAPRAPAHCRATVATPGGAFEAETEDVSARGCQLIAPRPLRTGDRVEVAVSCAKLPEPLCVAGKVAWASPQAPWRAGIAFDEATVAVAKGWFDRLVATVPGLVGARRIPERIPVDATVYLGPPPRFLVDFTADEAALLRAIASGARIDELQARLRRDWPAAQRALFSLMARQAVTLVRGQAAHPEAWKKVLTEVEASFAVESLGSFPEPLARAQVAPPARAPRTETPVPLATAQAQRAAPTSPAPPPAPAAPPWATHPPDQHGLLELRDDGPSLELELPAPRTATPVPLAATPVPAPTPAPRHDFTGAGVGWRARAPRVRTPEAQGLYERAQAEIAAGHVNGAITLLRGALALSPGDPEIAETLGKLAFKDRGSSER